MKDIDVLIVGGGPTGLMLALELSAHNIHFRIIDSSPVRSDKSRALTLHPRTLELLNRHGITEQFTKRGKFNGAVCLFSNQTFVFENDFESLAFEDTLYRTPLLISQAEIESVLDNVLLKRGVQVERPVAAETITQDQNGVTATLLLGDGSEEFLRCKYVVGCDGPRSTVRKSAGLKFDGDAYRQDFILADVHMNWGKRDCLHIFIGYQNVTVFPLKDNIWRIVCAQKAQSDVDAEPKLEDFQQAMDSLLPSPIPLSDPIWLSRFKLHHRIADNYRAGRMFIAGDAAHIHSPVGGQGMNTGMQDAANLGWKLANVLRGEANEVLLNSYNIERRRIGQTLLDGTDRIFQLLSTNNPIHVFIQSYIIPIVMPIVMRIPGRRFRLYRFITQLGIRYRQSPIVGQTTSWRGTLKGGDRVPDGMLVKEGTEISVHSLLGPCRHTLLLFSGTGDQSTAAKNLFDAETLFTKQLDLPILVFRIMTTSSNETEIVDHEIQVHRLFGFMTSAFVLVRPDGHIEFVGPLTAMDELIAWKQAQNLDTSALKHTLL